MTSDGLARLGELRRRQGRLDEAAALFDRGGAHPIASLGRAAMALDQGEPRNAAELAERYLRRLPAKNRTERAAALELLIRADVALGGEEDLDRARVALEELRSIAEEAHTPALLASASLSSGWMALAAGDYDVARREIEDAVDLYERSGAPFETARTRIDLARVMERLNRTDAAVAEVHRALEALTRLDARLEIAAAEAMRDRLTASPRLAAAGPVSRDTNGLTAREVEVLRLILERPEQSGDRQTAVHQRAHRASARREHAVEARCAVAVGRRRPGGQAWVALSPGTVRRPERAILNLLTE